MFIPANVVEIRIKVNYNGGNMPMKSNTQPERFVKERKITSQAVI